MKFTFLGTGTSQGVPVIGCNCRICRSSDHKDKRLRTAGLISENDVHIAIDIGPDFRQQALRANIPSLSAIVVTHEHNDHVVGLDEVRPFNFITRKSVRLFAERRVIDELKVRFAYIFHHRPYPGAPEVSLYEIKADELLDLPPFEIHPFRIFHGKLPILGFRIGNFAYCTDVKWIPDESKEQLKGLSHLVISSLHLTRHHSHMNLEEALELYEELKPDRCYLTHISHKMGMHEEVQQLLPTDVSLAYDGLVIDIHT